MQTDQPMSGYVIATNRFGLGARPDDALPTDPQEWLRSQLSDTPADSTAWQRAKRTPELLVPWLAQQRAFRQADPAHRSEIRASYLREARLDYVSAAGARMTNALQSSAPFFDRLVHFWANHFAVSVDKILIVGLAGAFEADAIRPHIMGRFEDLLTAAITHPAMLLYLDQAQSIGPNSRMGQRRTQGQPGARGLNENLAREILELHTLGVQGGYTQHDVTELTRALTGWTLPSDAPDRTDSSTVRFVPALHEPGPRQLLDRRYPDSGADQARAILHDLALAPATARHIAHKLARHFVADEPPPALVGRLAAEFERTGGDLPAVYRVLIEAPESWRAPSSKFKTPFDWIVSSLRALGTTEIPAQRAVNLMNQLGQPIWRPGSPAGFDDQSAAWAGPDSLMRRVEMAQRLAMQFARQVDARERAPMVLRETLGRDTAQAIARAESASTALALMLVSPEFLRR